MIKKTMRKAVALLLLAVLALSSTGCVSGTVYGKPLDEAEEIDKSQAILYMSYIRDAMVADRWTKSISLAIIMARRTRKLLKSSGKTGSTMSPFMARLRIFSCKKAISLAMKWYLYLS